MESAGAKLIARYKKTYGIPGEANVTAHMVLAHWHLEKQLTAELLRSEPEDRWNTFDRCYTRLYAELEWLNQLSGKADSQSPQEKFARWLELIGPPPQSIYEIGSGQGGLISFLALHGYACKGTEITRERGEKLMPEQHENLSWGTSDGVHLDQFEPPGTYDVVVSDQVIEHLHPDDLQQHLRSAYSILKRDGRYIFNTPNKYTGPQDVSRVFQCNEPEGMHLKEYSCRELLDATSSAGFDSVRYGFVPRRFRFMLMAFGARRMARSDRAGLVFLRTVLRVETLLHVLPASAVRRWLGRVLCQLGIFSGTISLIAEK
jgi:SAM-dependent methyltransferase